MKVGDLVRRMNAWKKHNAWMDFDSDQEPILVLRVVLEPTGYRTALVQSLWTNIQFWGKCADYEVISESR